MNNSFFTQNMVEEWWSEAPQQTTKQIDWISLWLSAEHGRGVYRPSLCVPFLSLFFFSEAQCHVLPAGEGTASEYRVKASEKGVRIVYLVLKLTLCYEEPSQKQKALDGLSITFNRSRLIHSQDSFLAGYEIKTFCWRLSTTCLCKPLCKQWLYLFKLDTSWLRLWNTVEILYFHINHCVNKTYLCYDFRSFYSNSAD